MLPIQHHAGNLIHGTEWQGATIVPRSHVSMRMGIIPRYRSRKQTGKVHPSMAVDV